MTRKGPAVLAPAELLAIGVLFREGWDTKSIASDMGLPESIVANNLGAAREAVRRRDEDQKWEAP